ncbi:MAG TPA: flagellin [Candidatus Ozemobacteraceae bacterium]|nr:flagellin [Candidatus Ozemobacteraceae bacterium]
MSLSINQNILSLKTHTQLSTTSSRLEKSIEKLSSGLRINRAADDAAGLAISEKLRRQVRGLSRAVLNAQDGVSMIQAAEGALSETQSILQRMRELAIQSSNDTLTSNDRLEIQKEVNQLRDDINRIANNTEFNTKKLLDGSQTALISSSSQYVDGMVTGVGKGGGDFDVSITLMQAGISQMQRSQIFTLNDGTGALAKGSTQLQSIAQFYDSNGVFVLASPLELSLSGNSKTTSVSVDGQMSLDRLAAAIQNALIGTSGLGIANSKVGLVNTAQTGVAGIGGYLQMTSGAIGDAGDVALSADQALMSALGLTTIRQSKNNLVELTSRDAFGNIRQVRTSEDKASGLLEGIDLQFDSQAAQVAGIGGLETGLRITGETFTISAGGVWKRINIAAGTWTMEGLARSINAQLTTTAGTTGVRFSGVSAMVIDGQIRIMYEPVVAGRDSSFNIVNASANTIGLLNGSYSGFAQGSKDATKGVFGFSHYVLSSQLVSTLYTVYIEVNDGVVSSTYIGISVTDQILSPDMLVFDTWKSEQEELLRSAGVQVRIDAVNGGLAFTSLRVGKENLVSGGTSLSQVRVTFDATAMGFDKKFGLSKDATAVGYGDKNFRMHVVDNTPQFQIGADEGQNMKIAISEMSAKALGVDNLDLTSIAGAQKSLSKLNKAIDKVSSERSKLGAFQNRLEYSINNLNTTKTNLSAAESRIRDADMALEMVEFTRNQIVSQSGTAMMAQANLIPQNILQLLK